MKLDGKIALITGGSKGIGRSIAIELVKEGATVLINYSKDCTSAENTVNFIKSLGGYAIALKGDVSNYNEATSMVQHVLKSLGRIDILINNAGISKRGLFIDMDLSSIDELINVNLKGVINTCHSIVPYMISRKTGVIINISSIWGNVGGSCEVIYSATKGAINSFTKALGKELALSGIRVNAISPGVIDTEMNRWLEKEEKAELEESIPMGRFGEGTDIGKAAVFLCSEDAKYITSQVITIDGGFI